MFFPPTQTAAAVTFRGADNRSHVYLGGYDAYYWVRLTRAYLEHGTVCDRMTNGACVDANENAPVGQPVAYAFSPHLVAIALLYRLLARFDPGVPLTTCAMILPVVLSALAVIAAFALGALLAGPLGGFLASLLALCNPSVLGRTIEGDDDIWIVVLPLAIFCALAWSLRVRRRFARLLLGALAGALLALLAAAWEGWPFFAVAGALGVVAAGVARRSPACAETFVAAAVPFVLGCVMLGVHPDISGMLAQAVRFAGLAHVAGSETTAPLPDDFANVAELRRIDAAALLSGLGAVAFGLGLTGIITAAPEQRRRAVAAALALIGGIAGAELLGVTHAGKLPTIAVAAAAVVAAVALRRSAKDDGTWWLLLPWLLASLWIAFDAVRYAMLAVLPLALFAGGSGARIAGILVTRHPAKLALRAAGIAAACCVAAGTVVPAAIAGAGVVHDQSPEINAAWIDTLHAIRATTPPNTIVNVWWDRGHWAAYYARRAVTVDGATLRNSTNFWLAQALGAPSSAVSARYLRMLNCGDVTDRATGTRARPFETLSAWTGDGARAYRLLSDLMRMPAAAHDAYLARAGLNSRQRAALLGAIDCQPPPSRLVLSNELLADQSWYTEAFWDPARAYRFDTGAVTDRSPEARQAFAAPQGKTVSDGWSPCAIAGSLLRCAIAYGVVLYDPLAPAQTRYVAGAFSSPLASIDVVRRDRIERVVPPAPNPDGYAVLIDPAALRVFVGTPAIVGSTVVRLALLDGRFDTIFARTQLSIAPNGERVTSWRIRWDRLPAIAEPAPDGAR